MERYTSKLLLSSMFGFFKHFFFFKTRLGNQGFSRSWKEKNRKERGGKIHNFLSLKEKKEKDLSLYAHVHLFHHRGNACNPLWWVKIQQEKGMATHSCNLAWRIPRTEEPGGLQSLGMQRIGHNWVTFTFTFTSFPRCSEIFLLEETILHLLSMDSTCSPCGCLCRWPEACK